MSSKPDWPGPALELVQHGPQPQQGSLRTSHLGFCHNLFNKLHSSPGSNLQRGLSICHPLSFTQSSLSFTALAFAETFTVVAFQLATWQPVTSEPLGLEPASPATESQQAESEGACKHLPACLHGTLWVRRTGCEQPAGDQPTSLTHSVGRHWPGSSQRLALVRSVELTPLSSNAHQGNVVGQCLISIAVICQHRWSQLHSTEMSHSFSQILQLQSGPFPLSCCCSITCSWVMCDHPMKGLGGCQVKQT